MYYIGIDIMLLFSLKVFAITDSSGIFSSCIIYNCPCLSNVMLIFGELF